MPDTNELEAEISRQREVVLEFINRKPEKPKAPETKLMEIIKQEESVPVVVAEKVVNQPEVIAPDNTLVESISPVMTLVKTENVCEFKPKKPIEVKTGLVIAPEKKYDGPLICIVPKKNRTPKTPIKQNIKSGKKAIEKKHHVSRRESESILRNFLRTLGNIIR